MSPSKVSARSFRFPRSLRGRLAIGGGTLLILLVIVGLLTNQSTNSPSHSVAAGKAAATAARTPPTPKRYGQLFRHGQTVQQASRQACVSYRAVITKWDAAEEKRWAALKPIDEAQSSYAAADFVAKPGVEWIYARTQSTFKKTITGIAAARLRAAVGAKARLVTLSMIASFRADSLYVCHLTQAYDRTDGQLADLDAVIAEVRQLADSKPWYPRGYQAYDDNIAYKWDNEVSKCQDSLGICWGMRVVTRDGCPSAVYAEMNILSSSNTVVNFSNDTLGSLSAGQVGELGFDYYTDSDQTFTGQLKTINCY